VSRDMKICVSYCILMEIVSLNFLNSVTCTPWRRRCLVACKP
jgi:hypothetical protein